MNNEKESFEEWFKREFTETWNHQQKKIDRLEETIEHLNEGVKCTGFKNALADAKKYMAKQRVKIQELEELLKEAIELIHTYHDSCFRDKIYEFTEKPEIEKLSNSERNRHCMSHVNGQTNPK